MTTVKTSITKKVLDGFCSPMFGRGFIADTKAPGLLVQVTPNGTKSFQVYRKTNGKPVRVTLGRYPDLTIEQARKSAVVVLSQLAGGVNPNKGKRRAKLEAQTLADVFAEYLEARKDLKSRTRTDMANAFREVCPDWQGKPMSVITPAMVEKRHQEHGKTRSKARANLAMRYIRALFNFAEAQYQDDEGRRLIDGNPVKRLSQIRAWFRVDRRQTAIKPHGLSAWWRAVEDLGNSTLRDYFQFVLLTGVRRKEASLLKWADVDLAGRSFTIPATKNHRDHTLPLSDYLSDLLVRRKAVTVGEYVFADKDGKRPQNPQKAQARILEASGVAFCIHDLRRTFATIADSLDFPACIESPVEPQNRFGCYRGVYCCHAGTDARADAENHRLRIEDGGLERNRRGYPIENKPSLKGNTMHTLQFDTHTEQTLNQLATLAGKNADELIKDLVLEFLENQEDMRDAEAVLTGLADGSEGTVAWETVKAAHGL